mgnify:FL=1
MARNSKMRKYLSLTIFAQFFLGILSLLINIASYQTNQCKFYSEDFSYIYHNHFLLVDHLTIHIIQNQNHQPELNHYIDDFVKIMTFHENFTALEIRETFVDEATRKNLLLATFEPITNVTKTFEPIDRQELLRLKSLSSDSLKGYFIVSSDVETLHRALDQNFKRVIPEERATFVLHFVFSKNFCNTIRLQVSQILKRFWMDYNVVNVIAQTPCSCENTHVYIYRPFVNTRGVWGVTESHSFQQIRTSFRRITNRLNDFNKFPLKVGMFPGVITAMRDLPKLLKFNPIYHDLSYSKGFVGIDALILGTLSQHLNFDINFVSEMKLENYGSVLPNGTMTAGVLKDLYDRKIVYGANARYVFNFDDQGLAFTVPHFVEDLCVVVPKALKIPKWTGLFRCFNKTSLLFISVTCVVCTIFWYFIAPTKSLGKVVRTMLSYLIGISETVAPTNTQFAFLSSCLLFNIVMLSIVQGFMFKNFTTTYFYEDIDTLEELDKSQLTIQSSKMFFIKDESTIFQNLKKRAKASRGDTYNTMATFRNVATLAPRINTNLLIKTKYLDGDGFPLLHVLDECLSSFIVSHVVSKGSAFLTVFNKDIMTMVEAGLLWKWLNDIVYSMTTENIFTLKRDEHRARVFSLYDLQIAFYVVILGSLLSFLIFLCEILSRRK